MKAKDLLGKNISEDPQEDSEPKQEDDQVAAAYENISKKLSSLRGGDSEESEGAEESEGSKDTGEVELEEWKGPKPPSKEELVPVAEDDDEEEEHELRKVKLKNLETDEDDDNPGEIEKDDDDLPAKGAAKDWKPAEDDPLDEEEDDDEDKANLRSDDLKANLRSDDLEPEKEDKNEEDDSEEPDMNEKEEKGEEEIEKPVRREIEEESKRSDDLETAVHSELSVKSDEEEMEEDLAPKGPDTLDDLAEEKSFVKSEAEESSEEEDGYSIPHLRASRQEGAGMSYNTPPQREGLGQSYAPRGNNMEGNDPNNFFSQHQPQPAKRANKFHLLILVIIGIVVIGFTVYILKGGFGDIKIGTASPSPSPSATATPEATPTPTPEPEIERGEFTVRVLNGTSTSGLAGKIRDKMKELGYKTATPGNAADSDVAQTEIRVKEGSESATLYERLKLDLAPDYEAVEGEKLDDKVAYDAEVIIGAK